MDDSRGGDRRLRDVLLQLSPSPREHLRDVLIREQADRDAIASQLLRYRDERGDDWADIIDMLTMHPDARRKVARALDEFDATQQFDGARNEIQTSNECLPLGSVSVQRA
jgi:hypothetical protein